MGVESSAPVGVSSSAPVGVLSSALAGVPSSISVRDLELNSQLVVMACSTERDQLQQGEFLSDVDGNISLDGTFVLSSSQKGPADLPHNQVVDGIRLPTDDLEEHDDDNISSIWEDSFSRELSDHELKELTERLNSKRTKRPFKYVLSPRTDTNQGSETGPQEKKK